MRLIEVVDNHTGEKTTINLNAIDRIHLAPKWGKSKTFVLCIWQNSRLTEIIGDNTTELYEKIMANLRTSLAVEQFEIKVIYA